MAPSLLGKGRLALPPGRLGEVHPADEGRHSVCDEAVHRLPAHRDQVRGMRHDVVDRLAAGQVFAQKPVHRARRLPGQVGSAVRLPKRLPVVLMGARGEVHPLLQWALGVVDAPVADIGGLLEPPAFPLAEVRADGVAFPAVAAWLSAAVLVVADVAVAAGDSPQRAAVRHDAGRAASVVWEFRRSSRLMVEGARCSLRATSLMVALSFPCACPFAQANSSTICRLSFSLRCGMLSPCVSMTGDAASRNQAAPPPLDMVSQGKCIQATRTNKTLFPFLRANETGNPQKGAFGFSFFRAFFGGGVRGYRACGLGEGGEGRLH